MVDFADHGFQRLGRLGVELPRGPRNAEIQEYALLSDPEQLKMIVRVDTGSVRECQPDSGLCHFHRHGSGNVVILRFVLQLVLLEQVPRDGAEHRVMVAQYKGILHRILQADPGDSVRTRIRPFAEGMICACDEVDLVFRQGDGFIFEFCSRKGDNGHVKLSFQQKLFVHVRVLFGKQPQNLRQRLLAAERTDAQGNAAAFHSLAVPKLTFGLLIIVQKMPQMVDEDFTVGSRADALGGTEKEFDAFYTLLRNYYRMKFQRFIPKKEFFRALLSSDRCRILTTRYKGRVIGGCAIVYEGDDAYLWYAASRRKTYRRQMPRAMTVWYALNHSYAMGKSHLRFMHVGLPVIGEPTRDFLLEFGGKPTSTYRWFRCSIGWVNRLLRWFFQE